MAKTQPLDKKDIVAKRTMIANIRRRLKSEYGIKLTPEEVKRVLEIETSEIETIIASEKAYKYSWGVVRGIQKPPKKLYGYIQFFEGSMDNFGYSAWKRGCPDIILDRSTKKVQEFSPINYFEQEHVKFSTAARQFRKDAKLPELEEFEGLSEEEIEKICKEADKKIGFVYDPELDKNHLVEKKVKKHERDKERREQILLLYSKVIGRKLIGSSLEDNNMDKVEAMIHCKINPENNCLENFVQAREIKITYEYYRNKFDIPEHPEVYELYDKYKAEVDELGLEVPPLRKFLLKYVSETPLTGRTNLKDSLRRDAMALNLETRTKRSSFPIFNEKGQEIIYDIVDGEIVDVSEEYYSNLEKVQEEQKKPEESLEKN